jgi:hypothetical protein
MQAAVLPKGQVWDLPPVILHPFTDPAGPDKLVESSRAHLMLQGLLPTGDLSRDQIETRLLDGRYCEIRMLFYVGRDLERWIEQCVEMTQRDPILAASGIGAPGFIQLLVEHPPEAVKEKLKKWGVADYKAIFTRAIGLNTLFAELPERTILSAEFIRHYYRYADHIFTCWQSGAASTSLPPKHFHFDLYASGEYSRMLEREWEEI